MNFDNDSWECPDCQYDNEMQFWEYDQSCSKCGQIFEFDFDYIDPSEGLIGIIFVGKKKG